MPNKGAYITQLGYIVGPTGARFLRGVRHTHPTGSAYTVDPPVQDTDVDVLVLLDATTYALPGLGLSTDEWRDCIADTECAVSYTKGEGYADFWCAVRRGVYNLIVTTDEDWYLRAIAATELCRTLNYTNKADRVAVFSTVRDGADTRLLLAGGM